MPFIDLARGSHDNKAKGVATSVWGWWGWWGCYNNNNELFASLIEADIRSLLLGQVCRAMNSIYVEFYKVLGHNMQPTMPENTRTNPFS